MNRARKLARKLKHKRVLIPVGLVATALVMLNLVVAACFWHRTYPNTTVNNKSIGSVRTSDLASVLTKKVDLPASFQLKYASTSLSLKPTDVGAQIDVNRTAAMLANKRHWIPMLNLIVSHSMPLLISFNDTTFDQAWPGIQTTFHLDPVDAQISVQNGSFSIRNETNGYYLDKTSVKSDLAQQLGRGQTTIQLPAITKAPTNTSRSLQDDLSELQAQQQTKLTYRYQNHTKITTSAEVSQWYDPSGPSLAVSTSKVQASLVQIGSSFGIRIQNLSDAVKATSSAMANHKTLDFTLVAAPSRKIFSYCVATRGVDSRYLAGLTSKLQATYIDSRGWSLGGDVAFNQATSGCNFTVWLAAASQMPTFGAICDSNWSCSVSPNVIINFDRWQGASSAWNASGGNLEDYRSMVINHETGHWLGFGHNHCSGAGQLAPVMQQQSIDLEGCKFNPWPLATELTTLRNKLGL